jgi:hypothetical protein
VMAVQNHRSQRLPSLQIASPESSEELNCDVNSSPQKLVMIYELVESEGPDEFACKATIALQISFPVLIIAARECLLSGEGANGINQVSLRVGRSNQGHQTSETRRPSATEVERLCVACFCDCMSLSMVTVECGSQLSCVEAHAFVNCSSLSSVCISEQALSGVFSSQDRSFVSKIRFGSPTFSNCSLSPSICLSLSHRPSPGKCLVLFTVMGGEEGRDPSQLKPIIETAPQDSAVTKE